MADFFVNAENAGVHEDNGAYRALIDQIIKDKVCPFCPENLLRYHKKPILNDGIYWILTENISPYKAAKHQLLVIHKKHIETMASITSEAWTELLELTQSEVKKRGIEGGTFYMRFGDTNYTGASVTYLHANLVSPDRDNPNREPIMARVG